MLRARILYLPTPATPKLPRNAQVRLVKYCTSSLTLVDPRSLQGHALRSLWPNPRNPATSKKRMRLILASYRLNMRMLSVV